MTNLTSEQYRDVIKNVEGTEKIPTVQHLLRKAVETFFLNFGGYPDFAGVSPGKIVLFGEKTQASDGMALSFATPLATIIVGRRSDGPRFSVVTSADVGKPHKVSFSFSKNRPLRPGCPFWLNYVKGVIDNYKDEVVPPFEAAIESSVPIGSGLGSCSAIELATFSFLELLTGKKLDVFEKAKACQEVERNFALKEVGLLDGITASAARDRCMIVIDLLNYEIQELLIKNKKLAFVYIDSHFPNLLQDDYTQVKDYFDKACEILKVDTLRNCTENDVNNLQFFVTKILDYKEKVQQDYKEVESIEKFEETEETNKKKNINKSLKKKKKKLNFDSSDLAVTNKEDFNSKSLSSEKETKAIKRSSKFEKTEVSNKALDNKIKKDMQESEEVELNGEEEFLNENDLQSAEFYKKMINHIKLFLAEIKNTSEAVNVWKKNKFHDFGDKMKESHELLKNLNNFHVPVLDFLVQTSLEVNGVFGSRMIGKNTGGGGVITLIQKKYIPDYCKYIAEKFKENEKELKEKCTMILYELLLEESKNYKRQIDAITSVAKISPVISGKKNKNENCLQKIISTTKCYPRRRTCEEKENYLRSLINPCEMSDACNKELSLRKSFFDFTELNLRKKESLCKEIKPKRCGTWSRYQKVFSYEAKLSTKKSSIQDKSRISSKKISTIKEESINKINKETSMEEEGSKKDNKKKDLLEEENNKRSSKAMSKKSTDQNGSKKKLPSLIENKKKTDATLEEYSKISEELSDSEILDPSIIEKMEKLEQANLTFYVFSPFAGARMMFITKTDILRSLYANPVPHPKALLRSALRVLKSDYKSKPTAIGIAPGTITLFGEFMEFQLGYIICMALTMVTVMVGGKNDSVHFSVKTTSDQVEYPNEIKYPIPCVRPLEIESRNWANFIMGTVSEFKGHVPGFNAVISSSVPIQMGVNSCAALQACTFTFLENLTGHCTLDLFEKADLCGKSEFEFHPQPSELVTKCSSLKFFPTFLCKEGHLMFINCKRYKISQYYFDHPSYVFLIASCKRITTNVTIESLDERLKKCVEALEILKRNSLLSVDVKHLKCLEKKEASAETIKRVKYIISEHDRTIEAVKAIKREDYARVGLLMNQSHASLRDDYEVSCPEIELMIKLAGEVEGVLGAKMLGKGLTATIIILVKIFAADDCIRYVRKHYKPKTDRPEFYITKPSRGAFTMNPDHDVYNIP